MISVYKHPFDRLDIFLNEYQSRLQEALTAIEVIKKSDLSSDEFSQALADLHVCATVIEPYSEGLVEAIDQFSEDSPD
jgi:hypothetical protein